MSGAIRIAVVGAGLMGRLHARVVTEHPDTELVHVVDTDAEAALTARRYGAGWLATLDELFDAGLPDAAIVSVPTDRHAEIALPLIEAGLPVLIEKPIASSVEVAETLIAAAASSRVPLAVGHVERFNPAVRALQAKLAEGIAGRIFQLHARRLSPFPTRIGETGVALDLATHDLDVMCELAGPPVRVAAETDRKAHRSHEDLLAAVLRFAEGPIGVLEVNWLTPDKVRQLTVTAERGMFAVDYVNQHLTLYENAMAPEGWETLALFEGVSAGNVIRFAIPRVEPLRAQLDSFVAAIRGEADPEVTGDDGLRAVRLALAIIEAASSGASVALGDRGLVTEAPGGIGLTS
jgi:UDP-N-acetylglucosamine 3-dehydrogenase